jgi:hypothetical protein
MKTDKPFREFEILKDIDGGDLFIKERNPNPDKSTKEHYGHTWGWLRVIDYKAVEQLEQELREVNAMFVKERRENQQLEQRLASQERELVELRAKLLAEIDFGQVFVNGNVEQGEKIVKHLRAFKHIMNICESGSGTAEEALKWIYDAAKEQLTKESK